LSGNRPCGKRGHWFVSQFDETLAGDNDLEIVASGGLPENIFGQLSTHPYPLRLSPRVEDLR
jgi:hypothetical protein